jgi:hypothetical protein
MNDLVIQIVDEDSVFPGGNYTALLTGKLFDGTSIQGLTAFV